MVKLLLNDPRIDVTQPNKNGEVRPCVYVSRATCCILGCSAVVLRIGYVPGYVRVHGSCFSV